MTVPAAGDTSVTRPLLLSRSSHLVLFVKPAVQLFA